MRVLMIGLPGETENDFQETIAMNRLCQPNWYFLSIFFPNPGTELHQPTVRLLARTLARRCIDRLRSL